MAVPLSNTKLRVPTGFRSLLESFAREVLRDQPKDIYQFGAKYFTDLVEIRNETNFDPTELEAQVDDEYYNIDDFDVPGGSRRDEATYQELSQVLYPSSIYSTDEVPATSGDVNTEQVDEPVSKVEEALCGINLPPTNPQETQLTDEQIQENEEAPENDPEASTRGNAQESESTLQQSEALEEPENPPETVEPQTAYETQDEGFVDENVAHGEDEEVEQRSELASNAEGTDELVENVPIPDLEEADQPNEGPDTEKETEKVNEVNAETENATPAENVGEDSEVNAATENDTTAENIEEDIEVNAESENVAAAEITEEVNATTSAVENTEVDSKANHEIENTAPAQKTEVIEDPNADKTEESAENIENDKQISENQSENVDGND